MSRPARYTLEAIYLPNKNLCDRDTARSSVNVSTIPHGPILDIRARPIRIRGCVPRRARGADRADRRRGVELYRWLPGVVFLACSISERLLGVTGSIGWYGSISLVVPVP
jgi:hypothetical protein